MLEKSDFAEAVRFKNENRKIEENDYWIGGVCSFVPDGLIKILNMLRTKKIENNSDSECEFKCGFNARLMPDHMICFSDEKKTVTNNDYKSEIDFFKSLIRNLASFIGNLPIKDTNVYAKDYLSLIDYDLIYQEILKFKNEKFSIDFYLVELEKFKPINYKNKSDDLLSRQMYTLKSIFFKQKPLAKKL